MTQFSLAPHWVHIQYTVNGLQHTSRFSVSVVDDTEGLSGYSLNQFGGGQTPFDTWALAYAAVWRPLFDNGDSSIDFATLYRQLPTDEIPVPLFTEVMNLAGTAAGTSVEGAQATHSFKGTDGRAMRLVLLESVSTPHGRDSYTDLNAAQQALVDYIVGTGTVVQTRSGAFINTFLRRTRCYNDALTRKRFGVS